MNKTSLQIDETQIQAAQQSRFPFLSFDAPLEQAFLQYRHEELLHRIPIIGLAALVIFFTFSILDVVIFPTAVSIIAVSIRLFIICPLIILVILGAYKLWPITLFNRFYLMAYFISGLGIVVIIYIAHLNAIFLPFDGLLLHITFGYFLMGMAFYHVVIASYLISMSYFGFEYYLDQPNDVLIYNAIFMITINILGTVGSYLQERSKRSLFLHEKLLALAKLKDEQEIESKTRLLTTASHDLRQPLHAMTLLVETLEERLEEGAELDLTRHLKSSIGQLNQLFGSLLNISRLNVGAVLPNNQNFDLAELLGRLIRSQVPRVKHLGLSVLSDGPSPCYANGDVILLGRIINNLLENVFEHAQAKHVKISWWHESSVIKLKFEDDGKGIPEHELDAVFEEFHQIDDTHKLGMGLGLSIVKQLCDLLRVEFSLNAQKGKGCCFIFDLKVGDKVKNEIESEAAIYNAQLIQSEEHNKLFPLRNNLLVVDNDPSVLASMSTLLSGWGYNVCACDSPKAAIESIKNSPPCLVISDYHFAMACNGLALVSQLRALLDVNLPAILITADTQSNIDAYIQQNFNEQEKNNTQYLLKPVQAARLRLMLRHSINNELD